MRISTNKRVVLAAIIVLAYFAFGFIMTNLMANKISKDYFEVLGTKGLDLARMASAQLEITDADVLELKNMTYEEMLSHPLNRQLEDIFVGKNFSNEVKYVYLWAILEESEVKYTVTEDDTEYYDAVPGTPLNLMWLLDITVNEEESQSLGLNDPSYYQNDENRYTIARPYDYDLKNSPREAFFIDENEYGKVIVAYVPVYTLEDTFIGCLNVDIYYDTFETYINNNRFNFSLLFMIPTLVLTVIYVTMYVNKLKINSIEANTDPMTLLFNRRFLDKQLPKFIEEAYEDQRYLSVIMLDIDFFKKYNDNYGHKAGDEVIIKVADALRTVTGNDSDFVCRYGGEEMFILMQDTSSREALSVAQKIHTAIHELSIDHAFSKVSEIVTVSQGIYSDIPMGMGNEICNLFVERADTALYQAKTSGRDKFIFYTGENG